jgi:hypothetical protein
MTIICMDSQSAMAIAKTPQFHDCMKHIDIKYHFLCCKVKEEVIELEYVPTGEKVTDTLTKALNHEKHSKFTREIAVGVMHRLCIIVITVNLVITVITDTLVITDLRVIRVELL